LRFVCLCPRRAPPRAAAPPPLRAARRVAQ
jgi:hypothetical protein